MSRSPISGRTNKSSEHSVVSVKNIQPGLLALIRKSKPQLSDNESIAGTELNGFLRQYLAQLVKEESSELSAIEREVLESISQNELLSKDLEEEHENKATFGERLADKIASFGGSWGFIAFFFAFLLCWMFVNLFVFIKRPFDPYPFILLNLLLSCLAAIQAPLIMMSQNRKETKDRQRAVQDYKVNLKAELEIRTLHEKVDHLITQQNQRLMEIQQIQVDLIQEIIAKLEQGA